MEKNAQFLVELRMLFIGQGIVVHGHDLWDGDDCYVGSEFHFVRLSDGATVSAEDLNREVPDSDNLYWEGSDAR